MTKTIKTAKGSVAAAKAAPAKTAAAKPAAPKKQAAGQADVIKTYKKANQNPADANLSITAADGRSIVFDGSKLTKQLNALLTVGGSFKAVADYLEQHGKKAAPALARGVDARVAPHSSKAIQDDRAAAKPAKGAPAKPASADRKLPVKSALDGALAIKLTEKGAAKLKAGGSAGSIQNLTLLSKSATVAKALSNGLKVADINYAAKTGTITLG